VGERIIAEEQVARQQQVLVALVNALVEATRAVAGLAGTQVEELGRLPVAGPSTRAFGPAQGERPLDTRPAGAAQGDPSIRACGATQDERGREVGT
jgi:hypothetical protein